MIKQSPCFNCVKNRLCMSRTHECYMPHHSPAFVNSCHQITKGVAVKKRARVVSLKGFWNVNKFRRRTVRKKRTALIFEEKQMHHSKSEIKGIPLFSTHWLHIHYCFWRKADASSKEWNKGDSPFHYTLVTYSLLCEWSLNNICYFC